jgi:hypothetical protein
MNLKTVQNVAQKNNINLQKGETKAESTSPSKSTDKPDSPSGVKMEYSEDILGKQARIELVFTPESQTLHRLSIRWPDLQESTDTEFYNKVVSSLMTGYGKPVQNKSTLFDRVYKWNITKNSTLELIWGKHIFVINFSDTAIE